MKLSKTLVVGGEEIGPGESRDVRLRLMETYIGDAVSLPLRVIRAIRPGPVVFVCAAIHGDEVNGTGIIHELIHGPHALALDAGAVLLAPVVNVLGFENQSRYLPDRRDLNRSFPGRDSGSMAGRMAALFMREIVARSDYGIDLHSAAVQRTNFPNVRGDLDIPKVRRLATAFGSELVVNGKGPPGSLRREACRAGCPTIILEAGEPGKMEPGVLSVGLRGVRNVLKELRMLAGEPERPPYQVKVTETLWVRAEVAGILRFHVCPGAAVRRGQAVATSYSILGTHQSVLRSPVDGMVLGMATLPAVKPGEPVCHLALTGGHRFGANRRKLDALGPEDIHHVIRRHLASNLSARDAPPESGEQ